MTHRYRFLGAGLTALALAGVMVWTVAPSPAFAAPMWEGCRDIANTIPEPDNPNKVTLCHFTGSGSNPFIINEVSGSAAASHADHHGDCVNPAGPDNTLCF